VTADTHPVPHHAHLLQYLLAALATLGRFPSTPICGVPGHGRGARGFALQVQHTLSAYLLAFAAMMLFHGALSDAYGRRPIVLLSLLLYTLASIGCAFTDNINALLALRALQG